MLGISHTLGIPFRRGGFNWETYWNTHLFNEDDLLARFQSRDGITLIDDYGNNADILLPNFYNPATTTHQIYHTDNGALDIGTDDLTLCIWMEDTSVADAWRAVVGKRTDGTAPQGAFGIFTYTNGLLYAQAKTTGTGISIVTPAKARTYGKCFILFEIDQALAVGRLFINGVQIGDDCAFTGTFPAMDVKYEFCIGMDNLFSGANFTNKFLGRLSDAYLFKRLLTPAEKTTLLNRGTVTGASVHYPLGTQGFGYDYSGNDRTLTTSGVPAIEYSTFGSRQGLNMGYDIWLKYSEEPVYVAHTDLGESTIDALAGYTKYGSFDGNLTQHNGTRSKILFTNNFFDRSNITIYSDSARSVLATDQYNFYDSTTPKKWDIEELNNEAFELFFNVDYANRVYMKGNNNPYDTNKNWQELIVYNTKKSGDDHKKVLNYCQRPYNIAGFALMFDDLARIDSWNKYGEEKLKRKYGWKVSFCIDATNEALITDATTKLKRLVGRNHCIANHTVNHVNIITYLAVPHTPQEYYDNEVLPLQGWINTALGFTPKVHGYAAGPGYDETVNALFYADGGTYTRPGYAVYQAPPASMYDGSDQNVTSDTETFYDDTDGGDEDLFYAKIDYAKSHNIIFTMLAHSIHATDDGSLKISLATLERFLQYCIDNNLKFYRVDELLPALFT